MTKSREEVAQLILAQRTVLDGHRHEGLTLVQKCIWTGHNLEAWKQQHVSSTFESGETAEERLTHPSQYHRR